MQGHAFKKFKHWGIVTDLPPEEVPDNNWTGGNNVHFQDTATARIGGYAEFAPGLLFPPIFALNVLLDTTAYWVYCGVDSVGVTDGTNHFDITPAAGLGTCEAGDWVGTLLNGIPVFTNGIDAPFYWPLDTATPCETLPDWPADSTCKSIRGFKYHLIAMNITSVGLHYGDSIWWSSGVEPGAIPQEWTPTPENDAGDMVLADSSGEIIDGLAMRDIFVVYKGSATYSISYVAGQYIYTQRKNFLTTGVQTTNCVAEINGNHWVFTGTDLITHDGQTFTSVVQYKVKRVMTESVDPAFAKMCQVVQRSNASQLWVCIPEQGIGSLSAAYIINTDTMEVGHRKLPEIASVARGVAHALDPSVAWDNDPDAWDTDSTFWNQSAFNIQDDSLVMVDQVDEKLYIVDATDDEDGASVEAYVERIALHISEEDVITRRMVVSVVPRIIGNAGDTIWITVGSQNYFETPITWADPVPFVIGTDVAANVQVEGRMHSIRFSADTIGVWKIHSYQLRYADKGLY